MLPASTLSSFTPHATVSSAYGSAKAACAKRIRSLLTASLRKHAEALPTHMWCRRSPAQSPLAQHGSHFLSGPNDSCAIPCRTVKKRRRACDNGTILPSSPYGLAFPLTTSLDPSSVPRKTWSQMRRTRTSWEAADGPPPISAFAWHFWVRIPVRGWGRRTFWGVTELNRI